MVAISRDAARRCALRLLLNEWLKLAVHRNRPFVEGPFVDWSGYSFASGHRSGPLCCTADSPFCAAATQGAPLAIALHFGAASLVLLVGFTRIALGAHFLTDVLAAIFSESVG